MEMKNKLFHHHKSKFSIVMRNFSLSVAGAFAFVAILTVPTYISIRSEQKAEMKATEVIEDDPVEETPVEEESIETYE